MSTANGRSTTTFTDACAYAAPPVTSNLYISGTLVDRGAYRVTLQRVAFGIEGRETLDFAQEVAGSLQGSFQEYNNVSLELTDGTTTRTVFRGQIVSHSIAGIAAGVITIGYHCQGSRWVANQFFTTAPDGSGRWTVNLPNTDLNWNRNLSGLSVGTILGDYFGQHSSQLSSIGIAQPPSADLAPLTVVPLDPVILTGRIMDMADSLLANWGYSKYQIFIDPDANQIRIMDTTALPAHTLTLDYDPIQVPALSVDISDCYTQVQLRGAGEISVAILSLNTGTLVEGWSSGDQAAWNWYTFAYPSNSLTGTIVPPMTTTTVTADNFAGPVTSFGVNYWSQAQIWVEYGFTVGSGGPGYQTTESAEVVSNTAVSGGQATFTVDVPFQSGIYTNIEIRGVPTQAQMVWRKYTIPNTVQRISDGAPINLHLVNYFQQTFPWSPSDGVTVEASGPASEVYFGRPCTGTLQSWFATFQIYPTPDGTTPGYIVFDKPTVSIFSSQSSMIAGTPDGVPCDIKILLPYSNGPINATAPSSGYQGTAYTTYGLQRTWRRDYANWVSAAQSANMATLAQNYLDTVKNAVISGTVVYHGVPMAFATPGMALNLTGALATGTQFASMNCSVRTITIEWPDFGGSYQVTQLMFDNRRKPWSGSDSLFLHPIAQRRQLGTDTIGGGAPRFAGVAGWTMDTGRYEGAAPGMDLGGVGPMRRDTAAQRRRRRREEQEAKDEQFAAMARRGLTGPEEAPPAAPPEAVPGTTGPADRRLRRGWRRREQERAAREAAATGPGRREQRQAILHERARRRLEGQTRAGMDVQGPSAAPAGGPEEFYLGGGI